MSGRVQDRMKTKAERMRKELHAAWCVCVSERERKREKEKMCVLRFIGVG